MSPGARTLPRWREPEAVLALATFGVAARKGVGREQVLEHLERELPGAADRIRFFDMPRIDVSSSLIRRRLAAGRPVRYLVPDGVAEHIAREGLYA
jgi:nicotinate-nucleotide adenylyltransferase